MPRGNLWQAMTGKKRFWKQPKPEKSFAPATLICRRAIRHRYSARLLKRKVWNMSATGFIRLRAAILPKRRACSKHLHPFPPEFPVFCAPISRADAAESVWILARHCARLTHSKNRVGANQNLSLCAEVLRSGNWSAHFLQIRERCLIKNSLLCQ